ncbi:hypothetical protein MKW94_002005 [Papaver nudicaule]|uniref:RING-type E3 ubiquitin transferase n=1 Tax=Papaver nudicaule TaxID=74823 RepID=A0AA42AYX8_PAPNU|nr:hypothetical protein [Papaver nudicaule]
MDDRDDLTYEATMELQERIGKVVIGLSKETISSHLKTRVHITTSVDSPEKETEICTICQDGYENKDTIGTLDCKHEYHEDCITEWLAQKNVCPLCKRQGLKTMDENKRETRVRITASVDSAEKETEICTICQDGYANKDKTGSLDCRHEFHEDKAKIGTLDCRHEFHEDCITRWLAQMNVCSICKRQGLVIMKENKREVNELVALHERIGKAERALTKETISSHLKTRVHANSTSAHSPGEETEICTICQDEYANMDKIGSLDCKHEYHEDCITQWLMHKNVCPICKRQGLEIMEENKIEVNLC